MLVTRDQKPFHLSFFILLFSFFWGGGGKAKEDWNGAENIAAATAQFSRSPGAQIDNDGDDERTIPTLA